MWRTCPACGSLVGDVEVHIASHGKSLAVDHGNRLRFGHPRDWPKTPGAPDPPSDGDPPEIEPPDDQTGPVRNDPQGET